MERLTHPWGPLVCPESRILILGSFPSVKSREVSFFYGHPQNRFWPMLAACMGEERPTTVEEKTALILRHGLALWDSIGACTITGSSDASVRDVKPVDLHVVLDTAPIERILCNGALSGKMYHRYLEPVTGIPAIVMPSTSPANASWSMARLIEAWQPMLHLPPD